MHFQRFLKTCNFQFITDNLWKIPENFPISSVLEIPSQQKYGGQQQRRLGQALNARREKRSLGDDARAEHKKRSEVPVAKAIPELSQT